jgi:hypothetical protein
MYSPKIKAELVMKLYKIGKENGIPMTTLVNDMLAAWVRNREAGHLIDRIIETYDVPQHTNH